MPPVVHHASVGVAGLLDPLDQGEIREVNRIYYAAGFGKWANDEPSTFKIIRPTRRPHHTISQADLLGLPARPGEVSLAHRGTLILDNLGGFQEDAITKLAETLETGISPSGFPARPKAVVATGITTEYLATKYLATHPRRKQADKFAVKFAVKCERMATILGLVPVDADDETRRAALVVARRPDADHLVIVALHDVNALDVLADLLEEQGINRAFAFVLTRLSSYPRS